LLADPAQRLRMGTAAIARSNALFSPAEHCRRWTELVQRVGQGAVA
jgi:hypothetical protein